MFVAFTQVTKYVGLDVSQMVVNRFLFVQSICKNNCCKLNKTR